MGKATQDLRKEHDAILHVLKIMGEMTSMNAKEDNNKVKHYNELVYFLKIFADKCHHGKEENYLFEVLIKNGVPNEGGPIGVLLQEHNQGREYIALMNKSLESKHHEESVIGHGVHEELHSMIHRWSEELEGK